MSFKSIKRDVQSDSIHVISYPHHEIHAGTHFVCRENYDLSINHVLDVQVTTPNTTQWAHLTFLFECENETEWWVYEDITINLAGSALFGGNRDRNSSTVASASLAWIQNSSSANADSDTSLIGATQLAHGIIGAGRTEGGTGASREEVILKQNEDYTVRFFATVAGYVNFQLDWYEHRNKT